MVLSQAPSPDCWRVGVGCGAGLAAWEPLAVGAVTVLSLGPFHLAPPHSRPCCRPSSVTVGPFEGPFPLGNGLKEAHGSCWCRPSASPGKLSPVASCPQGALFTSHWPQSPPLRSPRASFCPLSPSPGHRARARSPSMGPGVAASPALLGGPAASGLSLPSGPSPPLLCRGAAGLQSCIWQDDVC